MVKNKFDFIKKKELIILLNSNLQDELYKFLKENYEYMDEQAWDIFICGLLITNIEFIKSVGKFIPKNLNEDNLRNPQNYRKIRRIIMDKN